MLAGGATRQAGEAVCCESQFLFKIERTRDADEVYYDANFQSDGSLHVEYPVNMYWVRHTDDGRHEPLTWKQKRYAYGLNIPEGEKDRVVFHTIHAGTGSLMVQAIRP